MTRSFVPLDPDHGDEREELRWTDRLGSYGIFVCILCICAMSVWVYSISRNVDTAQTGVRAAQSHIDSEQQFIDAERVALTAQKAALADQHRSLIEGCQRLNQVRASDNTAHLGSYVLFRAVIALSALGPRPPASQQAADTAFLTKLQSAEADQSWTPMSNCARLVAQQGINYRLPQPIAFTVRFPPAADLNVPKR